MAAEQKPNIEYTAVEIVVKTSSFRDAPQVVFTIPMILDRAAYEDPKSDPRIALLYAGVQEWHDLRSKPDKTPEETARLWNELHPQLQKLFGEMLLNGRG